MSDPLTVILLFSTGVLAGISNAVAGGGTFFTFPVFLATGIPPVVANASNAVAVWPGHAFAVVEYRRELRHLAGRIPGSLVTALLGGAAGALLLTYTGNDAFTRAIPFLLLFATILFAFGGRFAALFRRWGHDPDGPPGWAARSLEFLFTVYGGFFGAGLGIMLMAGMHMLGMHDVQANNALKNLLAGAVTSVAVCVFAVSGLVHWSYTAVAFGGAIVGGLAGARIARWLPAAWLRRIVIGFGVFLTAYYFYKYYG